MILILAGPPGSGKGTQTKRILDREGFHALGVGQALRQLAQTDPELKDIMDRGDLVPLERMAPAVSQLLSAGKSEPQILDGFPRDKTQAEWLFEWVKQNPDVEIRMVVIEIPESETKHRLSQRGRDDDDPTSLQKRLQIYRDSTEPALEQLASVIPTFRVKGDGTTEEVYNKIIATGALQHADTD